MVYMAANMHLITEFYKRSWSIIWSTNWMFTRRVKEGKAKKGKNVTNIKSCWSKQISILDQLVSSQLWVLNDNFQYTD